jgi:glycerol uptake facilitator-like aquaporin
MASASNDGEPLAEHCGGVRGYRVPGSGIMAERLAGGNVALALLANTIATGAALAALILTFGPISGAQFNPAVSVADALERGLRWSEAAAYIVAQCLGGCA